MAWKEEAATSEIHDLCLGGDEQREIDKQSTALTWPKCRTRQNGVVAVAELQTPLSERHHTMQCMSM